MQRLCYNARSTEHVRTGAESEKQRMERQQEAEARRQREEELHAAILRKKALRQQTTASRLDEEALILQRKAEQRAKERLRPTEMEPALREPPTPEAKPARVQLESPIPEEKRSARSEVERDQRAAEQEIAEAAAAMRRDQSRELKRQAAVQAQLENEVPAERAAPAQKRQPDTGGAAAKTSRRGATEACGALIGVPESNQRRQYDESNLRRSGGERSCDTHALYGYNATRVYARQLHHR